MELILVYFLVAGWDLTSHWWFFSTRSSLDHLEIAYASFSLTLLHQVLLHMPCTNIYCHFAILFWFSTALTPALLLEVWSCCVWYPTHHSLPLSQCPGLSEGWTINSLSISCLLCHTELPKSPHSLLAGSVSFLSLLFSVFLLFWYWSVFVVLEYPSLRIFKFAWIRPWSNLI